jgi:FkbM family methyltransferase
MMGKLFTALQYASMGLGLGADVRSKWIFSSMLSRVKFHSALSLSNSRVYNATIQVETLKQIVHFREQDIFIFNEVLFGNPYIQPELYKNPPRCIIDLGAHVGLAALRFAAAFPKAIIHCYEPDPENFDLLQLNTQALKNIVLHQEAVGSIFGKAKLYINPDRHTASSLKPNQTDACKLVECRVKPLDGVIAEIGADVDLIKFDIEGVECEVFSHSQLVCRVQRIVGEMKAPFTEIEDFVKLFPNHIVEILQAAKNMYLIYLHKG